MLGLIFVLGLVLVRQRALEQGLGLPPERRLHRGLGGRHGMSDRGSVEGCLIFPRATVAYASYRGR